MALRGARAPVATPFEERAARTRDVQHLAAALTCRSCRDSHSQVKTVAWPRSRGGLLCCPANALLNQLTPGSYETGIVVAYDPHVCNTVANGEDLIAEPCP